MPSRPVHRLSQRLRESYRKNRGEIQGVFLRRYPDFVFDGRAGAARDAVPVFALHTVEPETFARQLRHLATNDYATLESADAFLECLAGERPIRPHSLLLTFDDGLEDLHSVAFPLLAEHGFRAVSFLVPSFVGKPGFCGWGQIREMQESGVIDFQSHTLCHRFAGDWPRFVPCRDGAERCVAQEERHPSMEEDFRRAREIIEDELGKPVRHLCYTDYDGCDASVAASRRAGYSSNFWGVIPERTISCRGDDPYRIPRVADDYLLSLPGEGRETLWEIQRRRLRRHGPALLRALRAPA